MKNIAWYFVVFCIFIRDSVVPMPPPLSTDPLSDNLLSTDPLSTETDDVDGLLESEFEYGNFFERDMDLDDDQIDAIFGYRNVRTENRYRWPSATVPYVFSANYSEINKRKVLDAMEEIQRVSCVKFKVRSNETDYLQFDMENTGCHAKVGRRGGKQQLNLERHKCFKRLGSIIHEILHALGFHHMQSSPNRDQFITVMRENIKDGKKNNFRKYNNTFVTDFNMPYDFGSIMHYDSMAFSKDEEMPTIVPRVKNNTLRELMGQRRGLSTIDIRKINVMYNCKQFQEHSLLIFSPKVYAL